MIKKMFIVGASFLMLSIGVKPANAAVYNHDIKYGESLYIIATNNGITVNELKQANGIQNDLIYAGNKLAIPTAVSSAAPAVNSRDMDLLARLITAEAGAEPFEGKVAVASVILNRINDGRFPVTITGNIFKPHEFESVSNGLIWDLQPSGDAYKAAEGALEGWDPTYGAKYFYNPAKVKGPSWIWTRTVINRIGNHVFAI